VTGATRSQAQADNALASTRRDSLRVWHGTYTIPPQCTGDVCTSTSTDNIPRFRLHADHVNVGWVRVELRRADTRALLHVWSVYATPVGITPGGRVDLDTGYFDCAGKLDSYFTIRDPSSGRWSARNYVSSICSVLSRRGRAWR
jgi:hypothetical protein